MALKHSTTYRYSGPASLGPHLIRLAPAAHARAAIARYRLAIGPAEHELAWQQDAFGNRVARMVTWQPVRELAVTVELEAELVPANPFAFLLDPDAAAWPFAYPDGLRSDLQPFLAQAASGARFEALAARFASWTGGTVPLLLELNGAVRAAVAYVERAEPGTRTPEQTLAAAAGSCRDSGWLLVQLLRRLGIAARFVSGYAIQLANGAEVAEDRADLHAWAEAYLPGAGWIGLDPTSGLLAAEGHVPLAATARLEAAAPVEGVVYGDVAATMQFALALRRLEEA